MSAAPRRAPGRDASPAGEVPVPNAHIPLDIVYHDDHLLIVNKPAGLVTQPGLGHARDSLLNGLFHRFGNLLRNLGVARDWGLLHRLDKDTSGLLVVALKPLAYDRLRVAFEERHVDKLYLAVVAGHPRPAQGVCQAALAETRRGGRKISVVSREGQQAITAYRTLAAAPAHSVLECRIKTGRLHQIRAHLAHLGWPVVGDEIYGPRPAPRPRGAAGGAAGERPAPDPLRHAGLLLHAWRLSFGHPIEPVRVDLTADPPHEFCSALARIGLSWPLADEA